LYNIWWRCGLWVGLLKNYWQILHSFETNKSPTFFDKSFESKPVTSSYHSIYGLHLYTYSLLSSLLHKVAVRLNKENPAKESPNKARYRY
jgi:hypothetical protein